MKKVQSVLIALGCSLVLVGCGASKESSTVYNDYVYLNGWFGCTDEAFYTLSNGNLKMVSESEPDLIRDVCTLINCNHRNYDCPSVLPNETSIFVDDGSLFYMETDSRGDVYLCEMDSTGRNRRKIRLLEEISASNVGYACTARNGYLAMTVELWDAENAVTKVLLQDLEGKNKCIEVCTSEDDPNLSYEYTEIRNGWLFVNVSNVKTGSVSLLCYKLDTQEKKVVDNWDFTTIKTVKGNTLYGFMYGKALFSIDLDTMERKEIISFTESNSYGVGCFEEEFFVLSTGIPRLEQMVKTDEENVGISFYDYSGKKVCFISTLGKDIGPCYMYATEENIYFYEDSQVSQEMVPTWYVSKKCIKEGNAQLIEMRKR